MSITKNEIKDLRFLHSKRGRDDQGLFMIEGPKLIEEAIRSKAPIKCIYSVDEWSNWKGGFKLLSSKELRQVSTLKTPNKAIATVEYKPKVFSQFSNHKLVLALDRINDPGNLGTILRIADWFGINQIICSPESVEYSNSKVVQASMGAIFRVDVFQMDLTDSISKFKEQFPNAAVLAADMAGDSIHELDLPENSMLIMGSESHGIDPNLLKSITKRVHIPGDGKAESLNVGVATGIICSSIMK